MKMKYEGYLCNVNQAMLATDVDKETQGCYAMRMKLLGL